MTDSPGTLTETSHLEGTAPSWSALGLAIAWSAEEPERVGEVALTPGRAAGLALILGRGGPAGDDPHPRIGFLRHRGSHAEPCGPLATRRLSRLQLRLRLRADDALEVENLGRLRLEVNGVPVNRALVRPGDTLQLGAQLLFLVVKRRVGAVVQPVAPAFPFGFPDAAGFVGESPAIWGLRERIAFVARRRGHVLVTGPSGSGKELVARAVHAASDRAERPMKARNAATIPESLADAEIFGNARNYPNVGMPERGGLIGEADGTSLFLDELGEISPSLQTHLLRVLDSGEHQRLGEPVVRRSCFRLIAATNRSLTDLRPDLLARFPLRIEVPGLDARREDVPSLALHVLRRTLAGDAALAERFCTPDHGLCVPALSLPFVRALLTRTFVSHARELEEILFRAVEKSEGAVVGAPDDDVPAETPSAPAVCASSSAPPPAGAAGDDLAAESIQRCLDAHNGVLEIAWKELGLSSRHALARLIRRHGIEVRKRARR